MRYRPAAAIAASTLLAIGCIAGPGRNPSPSALPSVPDASVAAPPPTQSATTPTPFEPTAAPSVRPSATTAVASSPAMPHLDPDLEAHLPATLVGIELFRFSTAADTFSGGGDMCIVVCPGDPDRLADQLGIPVGNLVIAASVAESSAPAVIAYRIRGSSTDSFVAARIAAGGFTGHQHALFAVPVVVGGRSVTFFPMFIPPSNGEYLFAEGDVLFDVLGPPPAEDGTIPALVVEAFEAFD